MWEMRNVEMDISPDPWDRKLSDSECLKYAAEFNLSETCFVELENENTDFENESSFRLR